MPASRPATGPPLEKILSREHDVRPLEIPIAQFQWHIPRFAMLLRTFIVCLHLHLTSGFILSQRPKALRGDE